MNFNKIKDLREDKDLLQKDIAKKLNIKRTSYAAWENGERIIPLKHLNTLCNFYNVNMDYIVGLKNKIKKTKKNYQLDKIKIGQRIKEIRNINNLTIRDLAKVLNTTPSTISSYEKGKTLILTAFAYQICSKYNISMDWLCGRD